MGIVDVVVPERHVAAAIQAALAGKLKSPAPTLKSKILDSGPARKLLAQRMRGEADKQAPHTNYPAPYALIALWEKHGGDFEAMKREEIQSFARLMVTETSRNLVRVFFLRQKLQGLAGKPPKIKHVHVIGAGAMGGRHRRLGRVAGPDRHPRRREARAPWPERSSGRRSFTARSGAAIPSASATPWTA